MPRRPSDNIHDTHPCPGVPEEDQDDGPDHTDDFKWDAKRGQGKKCGPCEDDNQQTILDQGKIDFLLLRLRGKRVGVRVGLGIFFPVD